MSSAKKIEANAFERALALARLIPFLPDEKERGKTLSASLSCTLACSETGII